VRAAAASAATGGASAAWLSDDLVSLVAGLTAADPAVQVATFEAAASGPHPFFAKAAAAGDAAAAAVGDAAKLAAMPLPHCESVLGYATPAAMYDAMAAAAPLVQL